jgi:salicylate hydroxylase
MRVIVVGGGIGGMATAVALDKAGFEPLVLERMEKLEAVGAGLGLSANAMKVMEHIGAADHIRTVSVPTVRNVWRGLDDNEPIFTAQYAAMTDRYGDDYYCAHRADLLDALVGQVPTERIRLGARVVGVSEDRDHARVRLESGEEVEADLVIGADGLRSTVRAALFGEMPARFTGTVVWRGIVAAERIPDEYRAQITVWPGPNRHAMLYQVRSHQYNLSGFVPAGEVHRESWLPNDDVRDVQASFADACDEVVALFETLDTALITPIYFRDPVETWNTDRIVLLGDAAHPSPPSAGQGAAMALEDAVTIAACLRRSGRENLRAALDEYVLRRHTRTTRMLAGSRVNLAMFNEADPDRARARNVRMRGLQQIDPAGETSSAWLFGFDPVAAAEAPVRPVEMETNPLERPEARRAFDRWRDALTVEDHAGLWTGQRAGYERFLLAECPAPASFAVEDADCDGVPALWVSPTGADERSPVVLHLHGGCFVLGSARASVELTGRLAAAAGGRGLTVDYRLGPENPYPAALEDALAAYRWLAVREPPERILLSGECAGGGLALALALALRDAGEPLPAGIHVVSPFCDLTVTAPSIGGNRVTDSWLHRDALRTFAGSYLDVADPQDPLVSPLHADLGGLPPLRIEAAAGEVLRDDAVQLADAARRAGVDVSLELVEDSVHSYVLFAELPEAREAVARAAALVAERSAAV